MYKAIYVSTGAYDAVLLENGTYLIVDRETWTHFLEAEKNGDDFSHWNGFSLDEYEVSYDDDDWLWVAAEEMGDIVAYYDEFGKLEIYDPCLFDEREEFWER